MHKKDFLPLYCVHISRFHSAVTSNPKSFSPAATLDPRPRLWTRDRDIGPATATLDPRPATISQTPMILDGSERSFSRALYVLDIFANVSDLKANCEKTEALWMGSHKHTNAVIPSSKPIFCAEGKVYALGFWFSTSRPANIDNNFTEKIEKIKKILGSWSARRLTLILYG